MNNAAVDLWEFPFANDSDEELAGMMADYQAQAANPNSPEHAAMVAEDIAIIEREYARRAQ